MELNTSVYFDKRGPKKNGGGKAVVHRNNGTKGVKAKPNKPKGKGKGKQVDSGKKGPEVDNDKPNYIKGGRAPPKNLPRNIFSF